MLPIRSSLVKTKILHLALIFVGYVVFVRGRVARNIRFEEAYSLC